MGVEYSIGLAIGMGLAAYLLFALVRPERF